MRNNTRDENGFDVPVDMNPAHIEVAQSFREPRQPAPEEKARAEQLAAFTQRQVEAAPPPPLPSMRIDEEPLPNDLKTCFALLAEASKAEAVAPADIVTRDGEVIADRRGVLARLNRIRNHFHRLQQGQPTIHMTANDLPPALITRTPGMAESVRELARL